MYTVRNGDHEICKLIIENSVNKNHADEDSNTSLHKATSREHFEISKLIIKNGEDKDPVPVEENNL